MPGGDRDGQIQGEEGLAALGLAADDADGLVGPQAVDEPALLLGRRAGERDRPARRAARSSAPSGGDLHCAGEGAAKVSKNSFSSIGGLRAARPAPSSSPAMFISARRLPCGVIAQGGDELRGHELGRAGLVQGMPQALLQLLGRGALERQAHPHARAQGQESRQRKRSMRR